MFGHILRTFLFALVVSAAPVSTYGSLNLINTNSDLLNKIYFAAVLIALLGAVIIKTRRKLTHDWEMSLAESDIEDRSAGFLDLIVVSPTSTSGPEDIMIIITDEKQSETAGVP